MTAVLRVVLELAAATQRSDTAAAELELTRALVSHAPAGCAVAAIVPAGTASASLTESVPGLHDVTATTLGRRELGVALQLGLSTGIGGGMIHAPSLFAPLMRHDRVHDGAQTVVTLWDLTPWMQPSSLPRPAVAWHKAMLRRATRHADAVVVPTHAIADQLAEFSRLGDRIRVIAGAVSDSFALDDDGDTLEKVSLPGEFVLVAGALTPVDGLADGFAAIDASGTELPVVVLDAGDGEEPAIADLAAAAGIAQRRIHVRGTLPASERAAVFTAARAYVAASSRAAFPWRVLEALRSAVPIVAIGTAVHRDIIVDAGILIDPYQDDAASSLGDALRDVLDDESVSDRLRVLATDRARAFSWGDAAERVWQLHADL